MSEETKRQTGARRSKPWWWKPLWAVIFYIITAWLYITNPLHLRFAGLMVAGAILLFALGIVHYIRTRPSRRISRAIYVMYGSTWIGFALIMFLAFSGIGRWLHDNLGSWPSLIIIFTVPFIVGAFTGDWIGRRRNYANPLIVWPRPP